MRARAAKRKFPFRRVVVVVGHSSQQPASVCVCDCVCGVLFWEIIVSPRLAEEERATSEGAPPVCVRTVTQIPASVENCFEQKLLCLVW